MDPDLICLANGLTAGIWLQRHDSVGEYGNNPAIWLSLQWHSLCPSLRAAEVLANLREIKLLAISHVINYLAPYFQ